MQSKARVPERDEYEYRKGVAKNYPGASREISDFTPGPRQPETNAPPGNRGTTREPGIHQGTGDPPGNPQGSTMEPGIHQGPFPL